jgi:hypothetical protein
MRCSSWRGPALIGALAIGTLLAAGCTTTVEGTPAADSAPAPTAGPGSDPVPWADRLCAAVLSFAVPATSPPDFSATSDLPSVQRTFSAYLGSVVTGAQQGRAQLAAIGAAPEPAGDEVVRRVEAALGGLEEDFGSVKAAVDATDPNDRAAFLGALDQAESTLSGVAAPNPVNELATAPRLQRAAERAEQCQRLSTLAATTPR